MMMMMMTMMMICTWAHLKPASQYMMMTMMMMAMMMVMMIAMNVMTMMMTMTEHLVGHPRQIEQQLLNQGRGRMIDCSDHNTSSPASPILTLLIKISL